MGHRFVLILTIAALSGIWTAHAQSPDYVMQNRRVFRAYAARSQNGVSAQGRCHSMSYGTGVRSCGTTTGGPVGGNDSRN